MPNKNTLPIQKIRAILKKNKITRAGIFGSYAPGEAKKNSDVDILIKFNGGLHPLLKERILADEIRIIG